MSETKELTRPLIDALNQTGGWAERMNSGTIRLPGRSIHMHGEGTADILFFPRHPNQPRGLAGGYCRPIWIETKTPAGKTAKKRIEAQAAFRAKVEALGHRYIKVTSVQQGLNEALK